MFEKKLIVMTVVLVFSSCASLSKLVQKPTVEFQKVRFTDFSFSDLTLNFDLGVSNPNPIGIRLAGYDYNFTINEKNFLSGEQTQDIQILANATSTVTIPVTVKFKELYTFFASMKGVDEVPYKIAGHILVDMPLSPLKIPYRVKGQFPAVKLPKISLQNVKVESFSFSSIKLNLGINVDNPNIFGFSLNNFDYKIDLSGKRIISGVTDYQNMIPNKGKGTINIPVALNFSAVSSILTEALRKGSISYNLAGGGNFKTEYGAVALPIDSKGVAKIWK